MMIWVFKRTVAALLWVQILALLVLPVDAAPPLGTDSTPPDDLPATYPMAADNSGTPETSAGTWTQGAGSTTDGTTGSEVTETGEGNQGQPMLTECPPNTPIRIDSEVCVSQDVIDRVDQGWNVAIDPETGNPTWTPGPSYNATTGNWGNYNAGTEACDPNIEVKLKQAALAGSQITRSISDKQMSYPEVDPIAAVNNPQMDGYGGVCTIDLFAFDLGRLLGDTYGQIKGLIDTLSNLSVNSLFGAGCQAINTIFGDMQNQLLQDVQSSAPVTSFQQFMNTLTIGYISPLSSFTNYGLTTQTTTATVPGVTTANPLQVSYVPGKGYVYMANFGSGNLMVVNISQTPLAPEDAVTSTSTPP